eukprot:PhM_4_TR9781/c2_g1_i8/m.12067
MSSFFNPLSSDPSSAPSTTTELSPRTQINLSNPSPRQSTSPSPPPVIELVTTPNMIPPSPTNNQQLQNKAVGVAVDESEQQATEEGQLTLAASTSTSSFPPQQNAMSSSMSSVTPPPGLSQQNALSASWYRSSIAGIVQASHYDAVPTGISMGCLRRVRLSPLVWTLLAIVFPLTLLIVFTSLFVSDKHGELTDQNWVGDNIPHITPILDAAKRMAEERGRSTHGLVPAVEEQRILTDAAVLLARRAHPSLATLSVDAPRRLVDRNTTSFETFSDVILQLLGAVGSMAADCPDFEVAYQLRTLTSLSWIKELHGRLRGYGMSTFSSLAYVNTQGLRKSDQVFRSLDGIEATETELRMMVSESTRAEMDAKFVKSKDFIWVQSAVVAYRNQLADGGSLAENSDVWWDACTRVINIFDDVIEELVHDLKRSSSRAATKSKWSTILIGLSFVVGVFCVCSIPFWLSASVSGLTLFGKRGAQIRVI